MTLGMATARDLDTRIIGAPLPPSMARTPESPMDAIIILSGTGPGPGLDIHILVTTPDPPGSQGITLLDHPETEDGTNIPTFLIDHNPGIFFFMANSRDLD